MKKFFYKLLMQINLGITLWLKKDMYYVFQSRRHIGSIGIIKAVDYEFSLWCVLMNTIPGIIYSKPLLSNNIKIFNSDLDGRRRQFGREKIVSYVSHDVLIEKMRQTNNLFEWRIVFDD